MFGTIYPDMGGGKAVENLFAAGRVLNGAAPYPSLAPPLAGPVPKVNATYLNLLVLAAEMQQVQDSCDDHGSGMDAL